MKKLVVFLLLTTLFQFSSFSQLAKANWILGGSGSFTTGSYSELGADYQLNNLNISPSIGYFVKERFPIGIKSTISNYHITSQGPGPGTSGVGNDFAFNFGPFARYYFFKNIESPLNFFVEGSFGLGYSTDIDRQKKSANRFSFLTGPVYFFNNNIGLEFTIGYYQIHQPNQTTTGIEAGIGFQIHLIKEKDILYH